MVVLARSYCFLPDIAKFYGGGAGYKTIWSRCAKLKETAQNFKDAVSEGRDPQSVSIDEVAKSSPTKSKAENGEGRVYYICSMAYGVFFVTFIDVSQSAR